MVGLSLIIENVFTNQCANFSDIKTTGTFLNIKEKVVNGERHTYVIELILAMKQQGWLWTEEFMWHKKNCYPGRWPNRFRDSWERLLQFNKNKKFNIYQKAVMVPVGDWAQTRLKHLSKTDMKGTIQGLEWIEKYLKLLNRQWLIRQMCLHCTETSNKHIVLFSKDLPWFIKLFTKKGDVVLDHFS